MDYANVSLKDRQIESPTGIDRPIYVTRPFLPPLEEFLPYLERIWDKKWLTNNGEFHRQFEAELAEFLGVRYLSLFANGTLALITALQALRISGEVITTPYSFVATTHALWWNNIQPVFADIEPEFFTLDPEKVEAAISPRTSAILAVHVYGYPARIEELQELADIYGLKIIYDAAHAFGVKKDGISVLNFGDLSILSFHATKVFHTFEGGAIVCHDEKMKKRIDFLKNFGFANEVTVVQPGINAKMNEVQAAMGLLQLKYFDRVVAARKKVAEFYREHLKDIPGITFPEDIPGVQHNYSYFPVFIHSAEYGRTREEVYQLFRDHHIMVRRYFYPLISNLPIYHALPSASKENLPVANRISEEVLCLPIYDDLEEQQLEKIVDILRTSQE
jgi:dTDP-4-amino-4,6-dideoxygalactose transaminase